MRSEIISHLVFKAFAFSGILLQIDQIMSPDVMKWGNSVTTIGLLVIAVRYFMRQIEKIQNEFSDKWQKQEDRHREDMKMREDLHTMQMDKLEAQLLEKTEEVTELKVKIAELKPK